MIVHHLRGLAAVADNTVEMFFMQPTGTTPYDWNFRLGGIGVRVHPLFWLVTFLMASHTSFASVSSWFVACFISLLVHELGHVLAMRFTGGNGEVLLYGFGGLASPTRTWRQSVADKVLIAFAGPLAGFVLAAALVALTMGIGGVVAMRTAGIGLPTLVGSVGDLATDVPAVHRFVQFLLNHMLWVNIYWGLINLVPVMPLDGGHMARALFSTQPDGLRKSLQLSTVAGAIVAALGLLTGNTFLMIMFGIFAYQSWEQINQASPRYGRY